MPSLLDTIRGVVQAHGQMPVDVSGLADSADLYQNGLTSHASVNVMLALEDSFDVEFPDALLKRSTFQSLEAIAQALETLGVSPGAH